MKNLEMLIWWRFR